MPDAEASERAAKLLLKLEEVYTTYLEADHGSARGFSELLSGWFMPPGYSVSSPADDQFVAGVSNTVQLLSAVLRKEEPDDQDRHAHSALELIIRGPERADTDSQRVYLCAVQDQGVKLTEFLHLDTKRVLRMVLCEVEDPRRLLPSQQRLYKALGGR